MNNPLYSISHRMIWFCRRSYVDFVICSEDARSSKPDSTIFNLAVLKSNLDHLQPDEVLHIGDDFERDYLG